MARVLNSPTKFKIEKNLNGKNREIEHIILMGCTFLNGFVLVQSMSRGLRWRGASGCLIASHGGRFEDIGA